MRGFLIGTVATAIAFAVMTWLLPNIDYTGDVPQADRSWRSSPAS